MNGKLHTPTVLVLALVIATTLLNGNNAQTQLCTASNCPLASGELLKNVPYEAARFPAGDYSEDDLQNISYVGTGEEVTTLWLPSEEELATLEKKLQTELAVKATPTVYDPYTEALEHYHDYKRQYVGAVIGSEKVIIATLDRCSEFEEGQLEAFFIPFLPSDGGSCFLELVFSVESKTFTRLYIHGEA